MLRRSVLSWVVTGVLAVTTAGFVGYSVSPARAATATTKPERHPELHAAMRHLREAKLSLESAAHDYGGHRVDAVKATDAAIREVEAAMAFDKD